MQLDDNEKREKSICTDRMLSFRQVKIYLCTEYPWEAIQEIANRSCSGENWGFERLGWEEDLFFTLCSSAWFECIPCSRNYL